MTVSISAKNSKATLRTTASAPLRVSLASLQSRPAQVLQSQTFNVGAGVGNTDGESAVAVLFAVPAFNASSISARYRMQLEKSGCTEMSQLDGCDIHKTAEQNGFTKNQIAAKELDRKSALQEARRAMSAKPTPSMENTNASGFAADYVLGARWQDAKSILLDNSWHEVRGSIWSFPAKCKTIQLTVVDYIVRRVSFIKS